MEKTLVVLFSLSVILVGLVAGAFAGTAPRMTANVPFPFYAGDKLLPAGEYLFEMPDLGHSTTTGSTIAVRTQDGSICVYLQAIAAGRYINDPACHVTFNRYGDSYFLSQVQNSGIQSDLPKTRSEKTAATAFAKWFGGRESKQVAAASFTKR